MTESGTSTASYALSELSLKSCRVSSCPAAASALLASSANVNVCVCACVCVRACVCVHVLTKYLEKHATCDLLIWIPWHGIIVIV